MGNFLILHHSPCCFKQKFKKKTKTKYREKLKQRVSLFYCDNCDFSLIKTANLRNFCGNHAFPTACGYHTKNNKKHIKHAVFSHFVHFLCLYLCFVFIFCMFCVCFGGNATIFGCKAICTFRGFANYRKITNKNTQKKIQKK